jgi:DNA invertase Pin-like site-specific DNA recombinase
VLVGYMRVSKADWSQTTDLQRDALLAAGIDAASLYEDRASGKKEDRLAGTCVISSTSSTT